MPRRRLALDVDYQIPFGVRVAPDHLQRLFGRTVQHVSLAIVPASVTQTAVPGPILFRRAPEVGEHQ